MFQSNAASCCTDVLYLDRCYVQIPRTVPRCAIWSTNTYIRTIGIECCTERPRVSVLRMDIQTPTSSKCVLQTTGFPL